MYDMVPLKPVAITLGAAIIAGRALGVVNPRRYRDIARKFPRAVWPGILFLTIVLVWSLIVVSRAGEEGMIIGKTYVYAFLAATYVGLIVLKFDFLAVRGLAILLLMLAKVVVDSANQLDTPWRLVMTVIAYIWAIAGMWFTVSPYRMRDMIDWATATDGRCRVLCGLGCAVGAFLIGLGIWVY